MRSIQRGAAFIVGRQRHDGIWQDFLTLAGESEDWTTAYIGAQLDAAGIAAPSLSLATSALLARQRNDGGWGYNAAVPTDGDSTAWALFFLSARTRRRTALAAARRCTLAHRDANSGGFGTYADAEAILGYMHLPSSVSLAGWRHPHSEITAVAACALAAIGDAPRGVIHSAWGFVRQRQSADGRWRSYWWTTPLYATLQAVTFASMCPRLPGARAAVQHAVQWVLEAQRADGGWAPRGSVSAKAFDTALALSIVSRGAPSHKARAAALLRGMGCLCAMQSYSGRWPSEPILRIPPPGVTNPDRYRGWRNDGLGIGVAISDRCGLFTAATAVGALALAERSLHGG